MPCCAVHDGVADVQLREVLDQRLDVADLFLLAAPPRGRACREEFGLGDEVDAFFDPAEARVQRRRRDAELFVAGLEFVERIEAGRVEVARVQEIQQALAPPGAFGQDQHAVLRVAQVVLEFRERLFGAADDGDGRNGLEFNVRRRGFACRPDRQLRMLVGLRVELLGTEEQRFGRQRGPLTVALHQPVAVARVLPEALEHRLQVAVQHHGGLAAEVVEHGRGLVEEQRQVVLDARRGDAIADVLVDAALGRVALEQLAPAVAEFRARLVVHREFAAGQQPHFGHGIEAALAVRIEGADRIDLVVEQVHAQRHAGAHRKQVDQAAAHRVFAGAHHLRHVAVARQGQLRLQPGLLELLLDLEVKGVARQKRRRREPVQRRAGRHHHHIRVALRNAPQRGQPFADQVLVRRKGVVRQRLPVREQAAAQLGREERDLIDQALRVRGVCRDDGGELALGLGALRHCREQQRVRRAGRARQREPFSRREFR